jgi:hypothetical protein
MSGSPFFATCCATPTTTPMTTRNATICTRPRNTFPLLPPPIFLPDDCRLAISALREVAILDASMTRATRSLCAAVVCERGARARET